MQEIKDKLDQIQTHLSSTEQVDPALKQEYRELDDNIRKMMAVKMKVQQVTSPLWIAMPDGLQPNLK